MSKFKIEKVEHEESVRGNCCLVDYYTYTDEIYQFNYYNSFFAKHDAKTSATVGIWRIKSLKNKTN